MIFNNYEAIFVPFMMELIIIYNHILSICHKNVDIDACAFFIAYC